MSDHSTLLADLSPEKLQRLIDSLKSKAAPAPEAQRIPRRPRGAEGEDRVPLSFSQERLWFLDRLEPGTATFNIPLAVALLGDLRPAILARALRELVRRHEALRTTFEAGEGTPWQRISSTAACELPVIDLAALPEAAREAEAERLAEGHARTSFDLETGPLFAAVLLRFGRDTHRFLLVLHHIISDGWSLGVLVRELAALYEAFGAGRPSPLQDLPVQYPDFALWQRCAFAATDEKELGYWAEKLGGVEPLELPTDRPRPAVQAYRGGTCSLALSAGLSQRLRDFGRSCEATPFMILLALVKALFRRHSGQDDVVVGSPIAGRGKVEIEGLIGFFLNTLVLRTDLSGDPGLRELVARVRETTLGAYSHQDVPFETLLARLQPERDLSRTPLFQILFNMHNFPVSEIRQPGLELRALSVPQTPSKFDMTFYVQDGEEGLRIQVVYNADLFDEARISGLLDQLALLAERAVERPEAPLGSLPLVTASSRGLLPDPAEALDAGWIGAVHERSAENARRSPGRTAVEDGDGAWTYADLDAASSRVAGWLQRQGVRRGDCVAVYAHRSAPVVPAVLGTLRAGAAFTMLDPAYPAARLAEILEIAAPCALVSLEAAGPLPAAVAEALAATGCEVLGLPAGGAGAVLARLAGCPTGEPVEVGPGDVACVGFTSGSTGRPKGILGLHGPLSHFLPWQCERFGLTGEDRFSLLSGLAHDPLQRDLFTPLYLGAAIVVPDPADIGVPGRLAAWMARERVSVAHLTPAMAQLVTEGAADGQAADLRLVLLVGDVLTRLDVARIRALAPRVTCINLYGSTETQRAVAFHVAGIPEEGAAEPAGKQVLPLGRGMKDVQLLVLNRAGHLAGVGELGEIAVRSPHLALGYLGDEALTADRFRVNPFTGAAGDRIYRTGDLGRYLPNGEVVFAGRSDFQVKIRGYRIEPGEVEATLAGLAGVREAIVAAQEDGGEKRLAAFVVPEPGARIGEESLRESLRERLPSYMVPAAFELLPALPITPNGKVDRRALSLRTLRPAAAAEGYAAPRNPIEEVLASLWAELLRLDRVSIDADFFSLGGHSLLVTRLVSRIRAAFDVELPLRALFDRPTVAGLGHLIEEAMRTGDPVAPPLERVPRDRDLPLSFAQQRLWFLDQIEPGSSSYNVPAVLRLRGPLDAEVLARSLSEIVRRHEALRTVFPSAAGRPTQRIEPPPSRALKIVDLSTLDGGDAELARWTRAETVRPFDLARGPLFRATLLRLAGDDHVLLLVAHHIVCDGWSIGLFVRELSLLYAAFAEGEGSPLPELAVQYADFAAWQRQWLAGDVLETRLDYWRGRLAGAPSSLDLPVDRPRPAAPTFQGASVPVALSVELSGRLQELSRRHGATLFMTLLAGFSALLSRLGGQDDLVVGTPVAGRTRLEVEELIGFFVNTLPLRADLSGDPALAELVARVRETSISAHAHQDLPFEKLVAELQPARNAGYAPLFQVLFVLQNAPREALRISRLALEMLPVDSRAARLDLALSLTELESGIAGVLEFNRDVLDAATVRRIGERLAILLDGWTLAPERRVSELPVWTPGERAQIVSEWNDTGAAPAWDGPVHESFGRCARQWPDAPALLFQGETVRYGELDRRANRLAGLLLAKGAGLEARVGIALEPSPEMLVAVLGVLKSGGAYVPLDPASPPERLARMLADAGVALLLTQERLRPALAAHGVETICLDAEQEGIEGARPAVDVGSAAYTIYTSGSTGTPKGVVATHGGLASFTRAMAARLGLGPGERVLQFASLAFDASAVQIFPALASGAAVVLHPDPRGLSPAELLDLCARTGVTVLDLPAALWRQWVAEMAAADGPIGAPIRIYLTGGEAVPAAVLRDWAARVPAGAGFLSSYGPTEATVTTTAFQTVREEVGALSLAEVPIGRPLANARVYLLDPGLAPVPVGVTGELWIGGAGVTRGYLGHPAFTAERYVPDPFAGEPGGRLYRTGDLVRHLPDGSLQFLGRRDHQVKVRGHRVELGEVEAAIGSLPGVREKAVTAREGTAGDRRLVAYVVPEAPEAFSAVDLLAALRKVLPEAMVPSFVVTLEEIPVTPSGKVDRRALAALEVPEPAAASAWMAPRTPVEELLAGCFAEVLKVERVGAADSFFELGGHSLLATQLVSRVREAFGIELPMRTLFEAPTVAALAEAVEQALREGVCGTVPALVPVPRHGALPLSFAQQRLWFLDRMEPGVTAYNIPAAVLLEGRLDVPALAAALAEIVRRHEVLRTTFGSTPEGEAVQVVAPAAPFSLPVVSLSGLPEEGRLPLAERLAREEARRPFDLSRGPLLRVTLLDLGGERHAAHLNMHHIVSDGWSMGLLVNELGALYAAFSQGRPSPLPELPVQYADFAAWQRRWLTGEVLAAELSWWRERLGGAGSGRLDLPMDRPRPAVQTYRGGSVPFGLPAELLEGLHALSRQQGATLFMTLLAGFQALLGRYAGQEDVSVGTPIAGRNRYETEGLIGFFVNNLVLRTDLAGAGFRELLGRVRRTALEAYAHQDLPFEKLVGEIEPVRDLSRTPLFQVVLALQNLALEPLELPGLRLSPLPAESGTAKFDLTITLTEAGGRLAGRAEHNRDLFDAATIERLTGHLANLLREAVADPEALVADLPLLSAGEAGQLLRGAAAPEAPVACLHDLFARQAERSPRALAAVCEEERLTYGELHERSNRLARHLRRHGVGPESRVGLCLDRSLDLVVAILGVLKAGGAYVPLDPAYPQERLSWILEDALGAEGVLLTRDGLADLSSRAPRLRTIRLDADWEAVSRESAEDLPGGLSPEHPAYVIYTSGSTGRPKGVVVTHANAVRLFTATDPWFGFGPDDVWTLFHSYAFDFSVWELWGALLYGGRLVVVPHWVSRSPEAFYELLAREGVTVLNQTPSAFRQLVQAEEQVADADRRALALRWVVFGGEALDLASLEPWFRRHGDAAPRLVNMYGITETTVHVTFRPLSRADLREPHRSPIGCGIPDLAVHLVDARGHLLPVGVPGEIRVGGAGLARGYLNRPELTAERFVPDPFGEPGARLYRTGDLARRRPGDPEGGIDFLGRIDHQVKVRGFRIELGEIEAALGLHPAVRQALVTAREDRPGEKRLVAYVVPGGAGLRMDELRSFVKESLPDYMVPAFFVEMEALPLLPSGKVDRRALPAPSHSSHYPEAARETVAPRGAAEELLARIWSEVLGAAEVSAHDNFFELGGDSILSIQVVSRAAQAGLRLTPRQLFENPTVAGLARVAETSGASAAEEEVAGPAPLTPIQSWFFALDLPRPEHFNQALLLETGVRAPAALREAVRRLVEHHDALRLRFEPGATQQTVAAPEGEPPFTRIDLAALPTGLRRAARESAAAELHTGLDLTAGPLLRAGLLTTGEEGEDRLLLVAHHLVVDGVSWRVILEDLEASCRQVALPPRTASYLRWAGALADHARSQAALEQGRYWLDLVEEGISPLPVDVRQEDGNRVGSAAQVAVSLDAEETRELLQELPRAFGTRINDALLAAVGEAFAAWTGSRLLWLDLEGHGREEIREDLDLSRTVGWFTSLFPVLLDLGAAAGPAGSLLTVKEQLRRIPGNGLAYGLLRYLGGPEVRERLRSLPAAEVAFNYLGQLDGTAAEGRLFRPAREGAGAARDPQQPRQHLLEITGGVTGGRLWVSWGFSEGRYLRATIERLAGSFLASLRSLIACGRAQARVYTSSDFPLARLDRRALDRLVELAGGEIEDLYPLSPLQEGMLLHSLRSPEAGAYVEQFSLRLGGDLDAPAFEQAWQQVADRHATLRSAFFWRDLERPLQAVVPRLALIWDRRDWRGLPAAEQDRELAAFLAEDRRRGFDMAAAPLLRLTLIRLGEEDWRFVWSHHHILLDGWSIPVLMREIFALYAAARDGGEALLAPVRPYRDYIAWLERQDLDAAERFWRRELAGVAAPTLLGLEPPAGGERGPRVRHASLSLEESEGLRTLARRHHLTLNTLVQGAWAYLLHRYSGAADVLFGAVTSGRSAPLPGIEETVGLFINTLPARVRVLASARLAGWLREIQERQAETRQHEHTPLARVQGWSEVPRGQEMFESILAFENYPVDDSVREQVGKGLGVGDVEVVEQTNYPLTVVAAPGARLGLRLLHDVSRYEAVDGERLLAHLGNVLRSLLGLLTSATDPSLSDLSLLTAAERHQLIHEWNGSAGRLPGGELRLHEGFEAQAVRNPGAVAVSYEGESLTYAELDASANRVARHLRRLGVGPDVPVGICLERSLEMVIGLLAILKAGGAYVPLDPAYPEERLAMILEDALGGAATPVLVTRGEVAGRLSGASLPAGLRMVRLDDDDAAIAAENPEILPTDASPESLAYVIYTSGSTGRPKGVLVTHANAWRLFAATEPWFGFDEGDVWTLFHSYAFDFSVWEIWGALLYGGRVVVVPYWVSRSPEEFRRLLAREGVTVLNQTPSAFRSLVQADGDAEAGDLALRWVIFGGEALDPAALGPWLDRHGDATPRLVNMYGITETTVHVTFRPLSRADLRAAGRSPIGCAIPDLRVYLLGPSLEPVPAGVPGEIWVGGAGLARGYLGRPELTAVRFLPDPFGEPGARLYKTGDLARWRPEGELEFLGRIDHQVKIRGFRIELGEIEVALRDLPGVRDAVVLARQRSGSDLQLDAWAVPSEGAVPSAADLRGLLRKRLPEHMVPASVALVAELPLTPSGKLDRRALLAIEPGGPEAAAEEPAAPMSPVEELVAGVWGEVLGLDQVGVEDGFFDLGGHSLLATRVVSRLREVLGVELPVRSLFEAPTVRELACEAAALLARGAGSAAPPLRPTPRDGGLPLSFAQERLWFLDQLEPGSSLYNVPMVLELRGRLDVPALAGSLDALIARHEALRTTFAAAKGRPVQVVAPALRLSVPLLDLAGLPEEAREAEARRRVEEETDRPFNLARGPLVRLSLVRLAPERHVAAVNLHHIVSDAWSMSVLVRELGDLYRALSQGARPELPPLSVQYADFAAWQRAWLSGEVLDAQIAWWSERLAGVPSVLDLPLDRPRAAVRSFRGASLPAALPEELSRGLVRLGRERGATPFMTLLAAFAAVLSRHSGQEVVVVGSPVANRTRVETEGLIGFFVNALALPVDLGRAAGFADLLVQVRELTLGAYAYQDVPFEKIVEELQPERSLSHTPLFQAVLALQNVPDSSLELPGLTLVPVPAERRTAKFDLTVLLSQTVRGFGGIWEYNRDLFDPATVARIDRHLATLLAAAVARPERPLAELPLLAAPERFQIVSGWNDTAAEYDREACLHELFEAQVERTPNAVAATFAGQELTYRQLDERASQLAYHLAELGARAGSLVAVYLERSPEMLVAVLGILKTGAAYVPLDAHYPEARIAWILAELGIRQVVTQGSKLAALERILPQTQVADVIDLVRDEAAPALPGVRVWDRSQLDRLPAGRLGARAEAGDLAYIIFTSGTTGTPKGVVVRHRPAINLIEWVGRTFAVGASDRLLFVTSLCFDLSVYDVFGILAAGGSVRVASDAEIRDPEALLRILLDEPVTFWDSAPAALQQLVPFLPAGPVAGSGGLRLVFLSGDWIPVTLPDRLRQAFPAARVVSLGGATEATVWSNFHPIGEVDPAWPSIPYGRPMQNARYHVLDAALEPCPIGVPGDLYIGGECLSAGYIQEPVLTASKYLPDPFAALHGSPGDRLYRTGDRARHWPDGTLEFLGRLDHQVKIRGFRVELGEIEAVLGRHPAVREAAVLARAGAGGHKQLVAYVAPRPGTAPSTAELREHLGHHLPEYMVPAAWMVLEALPVTANGKLDRKALPEPELHPEAAPAATAAPRTPLEELLAGLWAEVLGLDSVGVDQSFFDLGGHSLLATQVVARLQQALGVDLPLRRLFEEPTVAGLAASLEAERREGREEEAVATPPLERAPRSGPLPLSFAQQRLWFLDQMQPGSPAYNIPLATGVHGELDVAALRLALTGVVARHESLRTVFADEAGRPVQVILPPAPLPLPVLDLSGLAAEVRAVEERRLSAAEAVRPFDLAGGPMLRATLTVRGPREHGLLVTQHHIASDGWSLGILLREVGALYEAFRAGRPALLPGLPVQYADFAVWQRSWLQGEALERLLGYWRRELDQAPSGLALPTDRPAPAVAGQRGGLHPWTLPTGVAEGLTAFARQAGGTPSMVLLAALQALVHRYSGAEDLTVGIPVAGRNRVEIEGLIGFFVNTLVLRCDLSGNPSFAELAGRMRERMLDAHAHQDLPFEKLVEELRPERSLSQGPLFQILFAPVEAARQPLTLPGLTLSPETAATETVKVPLSLDVTRSAGRIAAALSYSTDLFDRSTVERLARHLTLLLEGAVAAPERRLAELPLLDASELHQLLTEWSGPAEEAPEAAEALPIHEIVARRARERATAPAVAFGAGVLTYGELDGLSGRLAAVLHGLGVGPEVRVGICVERSPEMVVGLLAILKAGGAYLPVDPAYPEERKAWMLADSRVPVLLTQEHLRPSLPPTEAHVLCLDTLSDAAEPQVALPAAGLDHAAYVIYTSGSTGLPKGVVVEHRGVPNLALAQARAFDVRPDDRVLQFASPSFDASVSEVWVTLAAGATLVLAPRESLLPGPELIELLRGQRVTHATLPPAALAALPEADLPDLRTLVVAGEACPPELAERWETGRRFVNAYGPTEATVCATVAVGPRGTERLPIGRPIEGTRVYLLDRESRPVPAGAVGELCLGGAGLARGYLERPELTAGRFVPDPFGAAGGRLYRTGDLARFLPDGRIELLGRIDGQVKVRGFRIEPGEVEAALASHPAVRVAAVVARDDQPGGRRLVAFVVPGEGAELSTAELRELARRRLPEHMVPAAFVTLEALPLAPGGKVDRRALATRPIEARTGSAYVAPADGMEGLIAEVWRELLGLERVGADDNFFDLGGHSLALVQVQRRLGELLGRQIAVVDLFRAPTVSALARHLQGSASGEAARQGDERAEARRSLRDRRRQHIESRSSERPQDRNRRGEHAQ